MDPNNLTSEQAYKIARHHFGEKLIAVMRSGRNGFEWMINNVVKGKVQSGYANNLPDFVKQCESAAAELRLAGWTPTHERLEWEPNGNRLFLLAGRARLPIATYLLPTMDVLIHEVPGQPWHRAGTVAEMVEHIAGWVESNLPYYLPPFPGASQCL